MRLLRQWGVALLGCVCALSATAAEVRVLTAGAFKSVVLALAPSFEKQTGHKLVIDNDTAGALLKRIGGGEAFDVVVLTPAGIEQLQKVAKVVPDPAQRLARVAIGVAVKTGAPAPDISTVDAFRQTLLSARAVAYIDPASGGSSGIYLSKWFETAGIAPQIRAKSVLVPGGLVAPRVVSGEADIALHQISEITGVQGATLVGPIPAAIQNYTVYAGGLATGARDVGAAQAFLAALSSAEARAVLAEKGMEAP